MPDERLPCPTNASPNILILTRIRARASCTGYTPTEAPMLRKKTTIESMKLPTHAPVWTGFGMMKIRMKIMINSVDSHLGIQTD